MTDTPAAVRLTGVAKAYGSQQILRDLDLVIPAGQFVAVVGRSGCGKSTLLRLVLGLTEPDAGAIAAPEEVAVAFQEPRLLPWLDLAANVGFGLRGADAAARVAAALAEVGLEGREHAWPLRISGGQAQRASLARALVRRPRLVLLDEPFSALDALTRLEMQALISRLWARHDWTVVMVTHDVAEAVRTAHRVVVLDDGRVSCDLMVPGTPPRGLGFPGEQDLSRTLLAALGLSHLEQRQG
ncbi:ABC transporter ATP-binding protein [Propionicicella superfundia]|uniref:ABC transporter ATP-binding protein n=1 Tax=Propionicicella superfundia TaxID=348582 RepID=UPI00041CDE79|nr:ABC transporter ATP-binding protein [Propionicicella superfundia]